MDLISEEEREVMNKICILLSAALLLIASITLSAQDTTRSSGMLPGGSHLAAPADKAQPAVAQNSVTSRRPPTAWCNFPPDTTMVAWYTFDESSGNSFFDLAMGNSGTGYPVSGPPTHNGGALIFDGKDQYVEAPSSIVTNFGPAYCFSYFGTSGLYSACPATFSIDFWINVSPIQSSPIVSIIDKRSGSPPNMVGYHVYLANGYLGLQLADGASGTPPGYTNYNTPIMIPADGYWYHVAVVIADRLSTVGIRWYLNGVVQVTTGNPTDRLGSFVNDSPLRIATRTADPPLSGWFGGALDEVEIYNRALTDAEVQSIVAAPAGKCKPYPLP